MIMYAKSHSAKRETSSKLAHELINVQGLAGGAYHLCAEMRADKFWKLDELLARRASAGLQLDFGM